MARSSDSRKLLIGTANLDIWIAPDWFSERLRTEFPQFEVVRLQQLEELDCEIVDAEIAMTVMLRPEQFRLAKKLRWIHSSAAAIHQLLFPELVNSNVLLTNGRDVHGPAVAEQAMGMIFALAKRIPQDVRFQQRRVWGQMTIWREYSGPQELAGLTLGIVGLGAIGRNLARHAACFGMKVVAVREHADLPKPDFVEQIFPSSRLNAMLAVADYVVIAAPVTPSTQAMIGHEQLAAMKPTAFLLNLSRGALVNESALIQALQQRKIAGAGLDVFEKEPLPDDSPLWGMENVLITPHTAGMNAKMWEQQFELFSENIRRYLAGQLLLALVDKKAGY
jgi:phosphoglycerate dehydrogenase-like enzyme